MKTSRAFGLHPAIVSCCLVVLLLSGGLFSGNSLAATKTDTPDCNNIQGRWLNELGSTLVISKLNADGSLKGYFISPSENGAEQFSILGWFNNTAASSHLHFMPALTFSISWGEYGSVSAWSGGCIVKEGVPTLVMIMNLALVNAQYEWDHMITASDRFTPLIASKAMPQNKGK